MTDSKVQSPAVDGAIDRDALLSFTRELIRIPSVHGVAGAKSEGPVAMMIAAWMRERGWTPIVQEVAPGRPNVIATIDGGRPGPTLCFVGHMDVVTAGEVADWDRDPFAAEVDDGVLWGRGAADMKGGLAAMLFAADALARERPWSGRLVIAALCDEEGMMLGSKAFVSSGYARGIDAALICEPEGGELCLTQKGAIRLRVGFIGRMAHGAMPAEAINPTTALAKFIAGLEVVQSQVQSSVGRHEYLGLPYLTPTAASAGAFEQMNVIPSHATLAVDIRTIPMLDHGFVLRTLDDLANDIESTTGCLINLEVVDDRPATSTDGSHPLAIAVANAHEAFHGAPVTIGGVPGTTDGTILWRDAQIPVVVYGPGGKWVAHQANEFVAVTELGDYAEVFRAAALRFLRSSPTLTSPDGVARS